MRSFVLLGWAMAFSMLSAVASPILYGGVTDVGGPRTDQFKALVMKDSRIPCRAKLVLPRLLRVAHDQSMRQRVWKRMKRQELYYLGAKELLRIEKLAARCNMSLECSG
jgi:hypothetical protein